MRASHWILILAAAGVVALLFFWRDPGAQAPPVRNIVSVEPMLASWFEAGEIDIEIARGSETLRLEGVAPGFWKLVEPVEWPVSMDYGERLVQGLWLTVSADPTKAPDPGSIDFASNGDQITLSRGATRVMVIRLGPDVGFESYAFAKITGDEGLWKVPLALAGALREPVDRIRSRSLLGIPRHRIHDFRIERADGSAWSAERYAGSWRRTEPEHAALADVRMRDILVPWVLLEAADFVDDDPTDLARYGLDPASGSVLFGVDPEEGAADSSSADPTEAARLELRIGGEAPEGGRYVEVAGWGAVVRVDEPVHEWVAISSETRREERRLSWSLRRRILMAGISIASRS